MLAAIAKMTPSTTSHERLLLDISLFITDHALAGTDEFEVVLGVCERLAAGGVPLCRMMVGVDTLHPLVIGRLHTWRREIGIETHQFTREAVASTVSSWASSPFHHLYTSGTSIFPVGEDTAEACERALAATDAALSALAEVSARRSATGLPVTGAYFALHVGDVFYGNIGGADRLDFTVIGPAVNEAARISAFCRALGRDVLVSQAFAAAVSRLEPRLLPMGSHKLRGVAQPQALFAVIPEPRRRADA